MPRWDNLAKQRQAELCHLTRPWTRSCGPKSVYGRSVSSKNAAKKHRRRQPEPPAPIPMSPDVSFVSHPNQQSDTDRRLEIYDRVCYIGGFAPTMLACGDSPLEVVGFCQLGTGAIACQTLGGRIIWIYPQDLERVNAPMDTREPIEASAKNTRVAALAKIHRSKVATGQKDEL